MDHRRARILLIGATGQVGRACLALAAEDDAIDLVAASRSHGFEGPHVDLREPETVRRLIQEARPEHVILTAAATDVAWCQHHQADSWQVNVRGTEETARFAGEAGATFSFVSTDYVFDGERGPYGEADHAHPINAYGAHKLAAEQAALAACPTTLIIRTCQVFGDDPRRSNYILRAVDTLRRGETFVAAIDLFGTPTYADDLARALLSLTRSRATGLWHVAGPDFVSRFDLARRASLAFQGAGLGVLHGRQHDNADEVPRPRLAGLRNERLMQAGHRFTRSLDDALAALASRENSR